MKPNLLIALVFSCVSLLTCLLLFGGDWKDLIQIPGLVLVCGGTLSTLFMSYTFQEIKNAFFHILNDSTEDSFTSVLFKKEILIVSQTLRKDGLMALDTLKPTLQHAPLVKYLQYIGEGMEKETFIEILDSDIRLLEEKMSKNPEILETASLLSPIFGMMGAVLGLIPVFTDLTNTSKLGFGLVSAFVTLVYGLAFAYMFFFPISLFLKKKYSDFHQGCDFFKMCLISLHEGVSPVVLEEKLKIYHRH